MRRALVALLILAGPLWAAERRVWKYEEGSFTQLPDKKNWEHLHETSKFPFHELSHTDAYVELQRNDDARKTIRLFADHAEYKGPGDDKFKRTLEGAWEDAAPSGKPSSPPSPRG